VRRDEEKVGKRGGLRECPMGYVMAGEMDGQSAGNSGRNSADQWDCLGWKMDCVMERCLVVLTDSLKV